MPTRLRKVRKRRGSRTMGWGQIGQHRKTGAKGGRGMAGGHKHKWTKLLKTDYFGKHGFYNPTSRDIHAININELVAIIEKTGSTEINLARMGVDKLIGKGFIDKPVTVIVKSWSKLAEEKITRAGGKVIAPQPQAS